MHDMIKIKKIMFNDVIQHAWQRVTLFIKKEKIEKMSTWQIRLCHMKLKRYVDIFDKDQCHVNEKSFMTLLKIDNSSSLRTSRSWYILITNERNTHRTKNNEITLKNFCLMIVSFAKLIHIFHIFFSYVVCFDVNKIKIIQFQNDLTHKLSLKLWSRSFEKRKMTKSSHIILFIICSISFQRWW